MPEGDRVVGRDGECGVGLLESGDEVVVEALMAAPLPRAATLSVRRSSSERSMAASALA